MRVWLCFVLVLVGCEDSSRAPRRHGEADRRASSLDIEPKGYATAPPAVAALAYCPGGGDCIPDRDFVDAAGVVHRRSEFDGKVVVLEFWASWSSASELEVQQLTRFYSQFSDRVAVIGVAIESVTDAELHLHSNRFGMMYPAVSVAALGWGITAPDTIPATWIYDRDGRRVEVHTGAYDEQGLTDRVRPLLAAP